jgi:hypothetical protein
MKNLTVLDYFKIKNYWSRLCELIPALKKFTLKDFFRLKKDIKKIKGVYMKSGWRTTEFWTAISATIIGILITLGIVGPESQQELSALVEKASGGIISLVSIVSYIWSRTKVKRREIDVAVMELENQKD